MQVVSNAGKISRVLRTPLFLYSERFIASDIEEINHSHRSSSQWQNQRNFSSNLSNTLASGYSNGTGFSVKQSNQHLGHHFLIHKASYATEVNAQDVFLPTEAVKEIYDKMAKSVEGRTMPPNAWMWSLIENCSNREDIKLLFQILQSLRRFRLSNLRIHANFNNNLCLKVTEACTRVGAIDFGKKTLWEHNVYGLTPTVACAHNMLLYAKEQNNATLMVEIMKLLKKNHFPMQPGTADIVFSICYNSDNWELISKYSKKFLKAGIKLRRTSFGTWMEFAAKRGDVESLWKIEKLRSDVTNKHNLATAFSCAKGFLLEGKTENSATVIHALYQNLPEEKRQGIKVELEKLVNEWPAEVVKHQKEEDRKALASSLKNGIPTMVSNLLNMGLKVTVDLEAIPC